MFSFNDIVTKEDILDKIPEEDIFERYLGIKPNLYEFFTNPLRVDNNPDCKFYINDHGRLKFKDFANKANLDCFNIVELLYNVKFNEALQIIAQDFNLRERTIDQNILEKRKQLALFSIRNSRVDIKVVTKGWTKYHAKYWEQYHIDIDYLQFYQVFPLQMAFLNGRAIYNYRSSDIGFGYYLGERKGFQDWKLYFPLRQRGGGYPRFYHTKGDILQGYNQLDSFGDILIISKSLKDTIALKLYGYNSVSPGSESVLVNRSDMDELKGRFNQIFTLFDNDRAGKTMSIRMRDTYDTTPLLFSKDYEKDFSDNLKKLGPQEMLELIEHTKQLYL